MTTAGGLPLESLVLSSWRWEPVEMAVLAATVVFYLRGFGVVRRQMPDRFPGWRAFCFGAGVLVVVLATASPLDAFAPFFLWTHMVQHLLLMLIAPPLLWLGAPQLPLLRGLPASWVRDLGGPLLAAPRMRGLFSRLTHPATCLLVYIAATWLWHLPALYDLALRDAFWHGAEHLSFLAASMLFWWPVIQPFPSQARWPRLAMVPYLLVASVQATLLSAFLSFRGEPLYTTYAEAPRIGSMSALEDQALAGALMWVPGSFVLLAALFYVVAESLMPPLVARPGSRDPAAERRAMFEAFRGAGAVGGPADLLRRRRLGPLLASLRFRRFLQGLMLFLAACVVLDGFLGPRESGRNLAGVLPWTYWRAFVVVALLLAGNLFCFACPFLLPREWLRRFLPVGWRWPRRLRSKWLAAFLLLTFFVSYELLGLWDSPSATAWIVVGYFLVALVVDSVFRGASFCKWLCPIGQFHFVQSMVSPTTVAIREPDACASCRTRDCLVGNANARGCELDLYLPRKVGNLDCTFCLDCVRACPHENIGLLSVAPAAETTNPAARASLGRIEQRPDLAALALLVVSFAFVGAVAMTAPFRSWERWVADRLLGVSPELAGGVLLLALGVVLPLFGFVLCTSWALRGNPVSPAGARLASSFVFPLVPLGLSMWVAHFLFHLAAGWSSAVPVFVRALGDLGASLAPMPFVLGHASHGMQAFGLLLLDIGLLLTLFRIYDRARDLSGGRSPWRVGAPFALLAAALFLFGVWITFQPMEMRGLAAGGGA